MAQGRQGSPRLTAELGTIVLMALKSYKAVRVKGSGIFPSQFQRATGVRQCVTEKFRYEGPERHAALRSHSMKLSRHGDPKKLEIPVQLVSIQSC